MKNTKKNKEILSTALGIEGAMHLMMPDDFNSPVKLKDYHKSEVIIIGGEPSPKQVIEINGVKYEKIINKPLSKNGSKEIMMASVFLSMSYDGKSDYVRKRPQVNIVKEFELIGQKKSNLSRADRDWVVNQFKHLYRQVE